MSKYKCLNIVKQRKLYKHNDSFIQGFTDVAVHTAFQIGI